MILNNIKHKVNEKNELKKLSEDALKQIIDKKYDTDMMVQGVKTIYKYGVDFCGKQVEVIMEK